MPGCHSMLSVMAEAAYGYCGVLIIKALRVLGICYQLPVLDAQAMHWVLTGSSCRVRPCLPTSSEALWLLGMCYENKAADTPDAEGGRPMDQEVRSRCSARCGSTGKAVMYSAFLRRRAFSRCSCTCLCCSLASSGKKLFTCCCEAANARVQIPCAGAGRGACRLCVLRLDNLQEGLSSIGCALPPFIPVSTAAANIAKSDRISAGTCRGHRADERRRLGLHAA